MMHVLSNEPKNLARFGNFSYFVDAIIYFCSDPVLKTVNMDIAWDEIGVEFPVRAQARVEHLLKRFDIPYTLEPLVRSN